MRAADTADLVPLSELGKREYKGYVGGLYPDGKNQRPEGHERTGMLLATQVKALDGQGIAGEEGKIVLLSVGMSNTTQEFSAFMQMARGERQNNPKLVIVDGAQKIAPEGTVRPVAYRPESDTTLAARVDTTVIAPPSAAPPIQPTPRLGDRK